MTGSRFRSTGNPVLDLTILAAAIMVMLLVRWLIANWPKLVFCLCRKEQESARVLYVHASVLSHNKYGEETAHVHTAGFETITGRRIKTYITHEDYIMLRAGSEGILTRKGGLFLGFDAHNKQSEN